MDNPEEEIKTWLRGAPYCNEGRRKRAKKLVSRRRQLQFAEILISQLVRSAASLCTNHRRFGLSPVGGSY